MRCPRYNWTHDVTVTFEEFVKIGLMEKRMLNLLEQMQTKSVKKWGNPSVWGIHWFYVEIEPSDEHLTGQCLYPTEKLMIWDRSSLNDPEDCDNSLIFTLQSLGQQLNVLLLNNLMYGFLLKWTRTSMRACRRLTLMHAHLIGKINGGRRKGRAASEFKRWSPGEQCEWYQLLGSNPSGSVLWETSLVVMINEQNWNISAISSGSPTIAHWVCFNQMVLFVRIRKEGSSKLLGHIESMCSIEMSVHMRRSG